MRSTKVEWVSQDCAGALNSVSGYRMMIRRQWYWTYRVSTPLVHFWVSLTGFLDGSIQVRFFVVQESKMGLSSNRFDQSSCLRRLWASCCHRFDLNVLSALLGDNWVKLKVVSRRILDVSEAPGRRQVLPVTLVTWLTTDARLITVRCFHSSPMLWILPICVSFFLSMAYSVNKWIRDYFVDIGTIHGGMFTNIPAMKIKKKCQIIQVSPIRG